LTFHDIGSLPQARWIIDYSIHDPNRDGRKKHY